MSDQSQFRLLGQRRFGPFFATQFLGAFNDNVFRNGLIVLVTFLAVVAFGGLFIWKTRSSPYLPVPPPVAAP